MTDYSGWTDEQVNEAIAVKRGWTLKTCSCGRPGCNDWWMTPDGGVDYNQNEPPPYTYEWRLAGELLDELPADITTLSKYDDSVDGSDYWECVTGNALTEFSVICASENPKRAICEAWLAWKGVE